MKRRKMCAAEVATWLRIAEQMRRINRPWEFREKPEESPTVEEFRKMDRTVCIMEVET